MTTKEITITELKKLRRGQIKIYHDEHALLCWGVKNKSGIIRWFKGSKDMDAKNPPKLVKKFAEQ